MLYSGKRILMGIGNDDVIQTLHSKNNRYLAFVFNRDLWCYDQQDGKSVNIFSFRDGTDESGRSDYDQHNVQILDVADDGTVEFLVYGYMNRGNHEGNQGLGLYSYIKDGAVTERFLQIHAVLMMKSVRILKGSAILTRMVCFMSTRMALFTGSICPVRSIWW